MWKAELLNKFIFQFMMASYLCFLSRKYGKLTCNKKKKRLISLTKIKVFLMPDVDVKKADRITVIQSTGQKHVLFAKETFFIIQAI